jgi:hypothetical protein
MKTGNSISCVTDVTQNQFKRIVIPAKTRRLVWMRAEGKCQFVDFETGKRCGSRYFLETDHSIKPVALGGSNDPEKWIFYPSNLIGTNVFSLGPCWT